jgi:hypothetical protein
MLSTGQLQITKCVVVIPTRWVSPDRTVPVLVELPNSYRCTDGQYELLDADTNPIQYQRSYFLANLSMVFQVHISTNSILPILVY